MHWEWDFRSPTQHVAEDLLGLTMEQCTLNVIRDHRWKYVHFAGMAPLLFDLIDDPDQFVDLAGDPAHAPVVAGLRAEAAVLADAPRRPHPDLRRCSRHWVRSPGSTRGCDHTRGMI